MDQYLISEAEMFFDGSALPAGPKGNVINQRIERVKKKERRGEEKRERAKHLVPDLLPHFLAFNFHLPVLLLSLLLHLSSRFRHLWILALFASLFSAIFLIPQRTC